MNSDDGNGCSHPLGFPIRTSPDHSLLATSRGFSQLTTSFFAYLRQGIHTHALSSLTTKFTRHTQPPLTFSFWPPAKNNRTRRENSMGLYLPAHRAPSTSKCFRTPAGFSLGTHKNLQPCRLPNLFSYQTSSSSAFTDSPA